LGEDVDRYPVQEYDLLLYASSYLVEVKHGPHSPRVIDNLSDLPDWAFLPEALWLAGDDTVSLEKCLLEGEQIKSQLRSHRPAFPAAIKQNQRKFPLGDRRYSRERRNEQNERRSGIHDRRAIAFGR